MLALLICCLMPFSISFFPAAAQAKNPTITTSQGSAGGGPAHYVPVAGGGINSANGLVEIPKVPLTSQNLIKPTPPDNNGPADYVSELSKVTAQLAVIIKNSTGNALNNANGEMFFVKQGAHGIADAQASGDFLATAQAAELLTQSFNNWVLAGCATSKACTPPAKKAAKTAGKAAGKAAKGIIASEVALSSGSTDITGTNNIPAIQGIINQIGWWLVAIAGASVILLYMVSALMFITAGSNRMRVWQAKGLAKRVTIGLLAIASVYTIQSVTLHLVSLP